MRTTTAAELAERLERVERDYRKIRNVGFVILAICAPLLLLGLAKPKARTVEAESVVLRDDRGVVRARLDVKDDMQGIALYDKNGKVRSELDLAPDGSPGLWLYDEEGQGRVSLKKGFGDSWSLAFLSERGKDVARLGVDFKGVPYMQLLDKDDKMIWSAP